MLVLASLPVFQMFTITAQGSKQPIFIRSISTVRSFHISFTHSVNKTPVEEYYRIENGRFVLYKTVFSSYGAGMPELKNEYNFGIEDGKITITNLDTTLSDFSVFVGTIASHRLHFSGGELYLAEIAPPQSLLKFEVKCVSLLAIISVKWR